MKTAQKEPKEELKSEMVCEVPRSESEVYRISKGRYNGTGFVDLRIFFKGKDGKFLPSKKGLAMRGDALKAVIEGLERAVIA